MQHGEAIQTMASERYLLEELTPELREAFEEHFFECQECALDVRAGAEFVEHSKAVFSEPVRAAAVVTASTAPAAGWFAWLRPAVAVPVLALLAIIGYRSFAPLSKTNSPAAELNVPRILPSASLVNARGANMPVIRVQPSQSFLLFVDIPADSRFTSYVCELHSPAGALMWSVPVSAEAAKDTLPLAVPAGAATPGAYSLAVRGLISGSDSVVLATYPFELAQK